jgi:tryptophan synthase alpha subunit
MPNSKAIGVAFSDPELDGAVIGAAGGTVGFFGTTPVAEGAALTAQLTTITFTAPVTPDFAIQDLTQTTPFGFVSKDEGNTVLSVIKNLQDRVGQLESRLQAYGLLP